jgi:hypothetical protein
MNLRFGSGDSMSSRYTTNRERGDLSSFSLSNGRWMRGMQPTNACLTTSGFVHSVPAKQPANQSEAGCSVTCVTFVRFSKEIEP